MQLRHWFYGLAVVAGTLLALIAPARAQRGGATAVGTPVSATYKGLTTTRAYQPMPTVTPAGPAGNPPAATTTYPAVHVEPITEQIRRTYRNNRFPVDPFYTKCITIRGILVVGSDKVSDWAFLEAAYTLDHLFMYSPQWVTDGFASTRTHVSIMADVEYTMDLPENRTMGNGAYNDRRSRGLGNLAWCSCAEENLLNLTGDPYGGGNPQSGGENITIHEFSHTTAFMIQSLQSATRPRGQKDNDSFWARLQKAFVDSNLPAGRLGIWNAQHTEKSYASTSEQEFWAEGAQAWFDNANPNNAGAIAVRGDVKAKDPQLAALLLEIYGDGPWRYIKTTARQRNGTPLRPPEEFAHLIGLDALRPQFPVFNYNNSPRIIAAATQPTTTPATTATAPARGRGG